MNPVTEQLYQSALALSEEERLELLDALLAECNRTLAYPFDDAWLEEIKRRSAKIDDGTAVLTPWPEVKERVRKRLEEKHGG